MKVLSVPKSGQGRTDLGKNIWKNFLEKTFLNDKTPLWENVKNIWKNFLEKAFYKKGGTLVEKSKILVEFFTSNCSPK